MRLRTLPIVAAVAALLVSSAVLAGKDKGETMWTVEGAVGFASTSSSRCSLDPYKDAEQARVPAGLRGEGVVRTMDCGLTYVRMELKGSLHGKRWLFTTPEGVTRKPPKRNPWDSREPVGVGWMRRMSTSGGNDGIPLDEAEWQHVVPIRAGETLQVLDPVLAVVRTVAGRELLVTPHAVMDVDPIVADAEARAARETWEEGRRLREAERTIAPIPPAEDLLAGRRELEGAVFQIDLDVNDLSDERFAEGWLDPVGQRLEHRCDPARPPREPKPCGAYLLDYSALGAWWPTKDLRVVALFDGVERQDGQELPRLKVLVRRPWQQSGAVAPAWAQRGPD
jgi:hypothetical protein